MVKEKEANDHVGVKMSIYEDSTALVAETFGGKETPECVDWVGNKEKRF